LVLAVTNILVSSANIFTLVIAFISTGKSLICRLKIQGTKTDPWGTPCLTVHQFEELLYFGNFKWTLRLLSSKHLPMSSVNF
jgi:hypothetical protein